MKQLILDRHTDPNNPIMEQVPTEKVPVYESESDARADLPNLSLNQIVAVKEDGVSGSGIPLGTWLSFENDIAPNNSWLAAGTTFDADEYPALAMMLGTNKVPERFDHNRLTEWYNFYTYNNNSWVMTSAPYDGFVTVSTSGATGQSVNIYINDVHIIANSNSDYGVNGIGEIAFKKGDKIKLTGNISSSIRNFICFYQHPMFIKAFTTSGDSDYQGTLATIKNYIDRSQSYSTTEQKTGGTWIDGKPIYRKCFYSATNWGPDANVGTIDNVDMPICIRNISANNSTSGIMTYIENYGDYYGGGNIVASAAAFKINTSTRVGTVVAGRRAQYANNYPSCIIVEYTKTTD